MKNKIEWVEVAVQYCIVRTGIGMKQGWWWWMIIRRGKKTTLLYETTKSKSRMSNRYQCSIRKTLLYHTKLWMIFHRSWYNHDDVSMKKKRVVCCALPMSCRHYIHIHMYVRTSVYEYEMLLYFTTHKQN